MIRGNCVGGYMQTKLNCTEHASKRAQQRGISEAMIAAALRFGRKQFKKGALYYSVGRKEIKKYVKQCSLLKEMNGVHLVTGRDGRIITVYKNKAFH